MAFQSLYQRAFVHSVHRDVAVIFPILWVQRDERQHINRRLKHEQLPVISEMREAVICIRACDGYAKRLSEALAPRAVPHESRHLRVAERLRLRQHAHQQQARLSPLLPLRVRAERRTPVRLCERGGASASPG